MKIKQIKYGKIRLIQKTLEKNIINSLKKTINYYQKHSKYSKVKYIMPLLKKLTNYIKC